MAFKFCPECGAPTNGANFCPNCGARLVQAAAPAPAPTPVPQSPIQQYQSMADNSQNNSNDDILKRFGFKSPESEVSEPVAAPQPAVYEPPQQVYAPAPEPQPQIQQPQVQPYVAPVQEPVQQPQYIPEPTPVAAPQPEAPVSQPAPTPVPEETPQKRISPFARQKTSTAEDKRKIQEIRNMPDETSAPAIRRKRPEAKKAAPKRNSNNPFASSGGFQDEQEESYVKIVHDGLYNEADEIDYSREDETAAEEEDTPKKVSRSANTAGSSISKYSSAIVNKATNAAAKHLIDEDKKLENVHKTYMIEEQLLADPNDPTYDGYYENVVPEDERNREKVKAQGGAKKTMNDDVKKTLLIVGACIIAMVVIIVVEFG